jgi:hypothetical protein
MWPCHIAFPPTHEVLEDSVHNATNILKDRLRPFVLSFLQAFCKQHVGLVSIESIYLQPFTAAAWQKAMLITSCMLIHLEYKRLYVVQP